MDHEFKAAREALQKHEGGSSGKKPKLHVHEVHVRRGTKPKGGGKAGYIAKHEMRDENNMPHPDNPEYPLADKAALDAHMDQHMPEEGGGAAEPGAADAEQASGPMPDGPTAA